jgi:replicative DNA helicase
MTWDGALEKKEPERKKRPAAKVTARVNLDGNRANYVAKVLNEECRTVREAPKGTRNDTLNKSAFNLGTLVPRYIDEKTVERELASAAADAGLGDTEIAKTLASGLEAGKKEPREIPERTLPQQKTDNDRPSFSTATLPPDDGFEHGDEDAPDAGPSNQVYDVNQNSGDEPEPPQPSSALIRLGALLEPALARVEARRNGKERPVPLLFSQHAEILGGGLFSGGHTFIAGTGTGKSQYWFQTSLHAAKQGVPVLYVGLELNEFAVSVRLMGEESGIGWSKLYTGRCSEEHIQKARDTFATLGGLPFYCDFGDATGWPPSRLVHQIALIRKEHPTGPILVVLDFLQLVGEDFDPNGRHRDLRERIGRAAYAGTFAANKYGAAVVLVSSTARGNYGMGSIMESAGLVSRPLPGHVEPVRTILNPEPLLGIGKESGEIEYSAESQSVLIRWPAPLDNGESAVILAVPKLRYGARGWFAMSFWSRFSSLPIKSTDELPEITKGGAPVVTEDELTERILETVRKNPTLTSKDAVATKTKGTKSKLLVRVGELLEAGTIEIGKDGCRVRQ